MDLFRLADTKSPDQLQRGQFTYTSHVFNGVRGQGIACPGYARNRNGVYKTPCNRSPLTNTFSSACGSEQGNQPHSLFVTVSCKVSSLIWREVGHYKAVSSRNCGIVDIAFQAVGKQGVYIAHQDQWHTYSAFSQRSYRGNTVLYTNIIL